MAERDQDMAAESFSGARAARHKLLQACPGRWDLHGLEHKIYYLSTLGGDVVTEDDAARKYFSYCLKVFSNSAHQLQRLIAEKNLLPGRVVVHGVGILRSRPNGIRRC